MQYHNDNNPIVGRKYICKDSKVPELLSCKTMNELTDIKRQQGSFLFELLLLEYISAVGIRLDSREGVVHTTCCSNFLLSRGSWLWVMVGTQGIIYRITRIFVKFDVSLKGHISLKQKVKCSDKGDIFVATVSVSNMY